MTWSTDFPTPGGFDRIFGDGSNNEISSDAFIAKLTPSGQIVWGSYLGRYCSEGGCGIALDASGNCYVTGQTDSRNFPTSGGFDTSYNGFGPVLCSNGGDAFVVKVTSSGKFSWGSYLGGAAQDKGLAIAADPSGNCYVTGWTYSSNFPTPGGFDTCHNGWEGAENTFVVKIWAGSGPPPPPGPLVITTTSLPEGVVGTPYSATLEASGGVEPYAWSISSGTLPDGLSLNSATGVISGTSATAGTSDFTVTVTDVQPVTAAKAFSIEVPPTPLTITTPSLPEGVVGTPYSATLEASGGLLPYTWSISSGTLPAGLSLDPSTGVIDGTPVTAGTSDFTVMVTDAQPVTASKPFSIEVPPTPLTITTPSLPEAVVGTPYSAALQASGGVEPYAWSVSSGTLPDGLSLDPATGVIDGTSATAGKSDFTVTVADAQPVTATKAFSIEVYPAPLPAVFNWLEITKFQLKLPPHSRTRLSSASGALQLAVYNGRMAAARNRDHRRLVRHRGRARLDAGGQVERLQVQRGRRFR